MTFKHKEYEVRIKVVQEQWLHLKMKFLLGYNMKIIIWWGYFSRWREQAISQLVGGGIPLITPYRPPPPQVEKTLHKGSTDFMFPKNAAFHFS